MKFASLISILVIFLLIVGTSMHLSTMAQGNSKNKTIEKDNLAIRITGNQNVPKYEFWAPGRNSTVYHVQFVSMFEAQDTGNDLLYKSGSDSRVPGSQQSLASWSWSFSDVTEQNNDSSFNMTGSPRTGNLQLIFVNHIGGNSSSFKFDVIINNYSFKSNTAMLVLAFRVTAANNGDAKQSGDTVDFGNGYMQVADTATAGNSSVGVGLTTTANGTNTAYLSYAHFSGNLVHDPTLGISQSYTAYIVGGVVVVILIIVIVVYSKRK